MIFVVFFCRYPLWSFFNLPTIRIPVMKSKSPRGRTELGDITVHNLKQLKRLNQAVFPVIYNDKFYKDVLEAGELAKLAYYNDIVVGGVCCRIDTTNNVKRLYIMTLGCLASYRRHGIGNRLIVVHHHL